MNILYDGIYDYCVLKEFDKINNFNGLINSAWFFYCIKADTSLIAICLCIGRVGIIVSSSISIENDVILLEFIRYVDKSSFSFISIIITNRIYYCYINIIK